MESPGPHSSPSSPEHLQPNDPHPPNTGFMPTNSYIDHSDFTNRSGESFEQPAPEHTDMLGGLGEKVKPKTPPVIDALKSLI